MSNNQSTVESSESCETSTGVSPFDIKEKEICVPETADKIREKCRERID